MDDSPKRHTGRSALVVMVPEADPLVDGWRRRYDPAAAEGVPAHVSVLYPFLDAGRIDDEVLDTLGRLLGAHDPFDIRFERCGRWPAALYLAPEPDRPLRALTEAVTARWPHVPPYGGRFGDDPDPHLTVAQGHGQDPAAYDTIEADLTGRLPVACRVSTVSLVVHDGETWHEQAVFPLGATARSPRPRTQN